MGTRSFALGFGLVFLAIGFLGFAPGLLTPFGETMNVDQEHGHLFGLFPVNTLHNLVHVGFGVWGLVAYGARRGTRPYAQATAIIYAVLTVFGLIPGLNTLFGLVPLYGHDIWLHALIAAVAAYFGFVRRETVRMAERSSNRL